MCIAGTIVKRLPGGSIDRRLPGGERGSVVIILVGIVMVLLGGIVFMNSHNTVTTNQLATAKSKVRGDAIAASVQNNLKAIFASYPSAGSSCLPPALSQAAVQDFRRFPAGTPPPAPAPILLDLSGSIPSYPCLIDDEDRKAISTLKIRVSEMSSDPDALTRSMSMVVEVGLPRSKNTIDQTFRVARDYRLRVLTLSQFGLIFHGNPSGSSPFVAINGVAKLRVFSTMLFADSTPPLWSQLESSKPDTVIFQRYVYARFPKIVASVAPNVPDFRLSYPFGIQTGVLSQDFVPPFLPDSSVSGWNHRFDYYPLYNNVGYAVPEYPPDPSMKTSGNCLSGVSNPPDDVSFLPARADLVRLPDTANKGPHTLKQTCNGGTRAMAFEFFRADQDLTLDLLPGDSNFCGLVVANRLVLNIAAPDAVTYGLIGHFAVKQIVINSPSGVAAGMEVRIYNPEENDPLEGLQPLPMSQSLGNLAASFKQLASSSAWNFYVPISKDGAFRTRSPADYLEQCSSGTYYGYHSTYSPLHLLPDFAAYRTDSVNSVYSLESL